MLTTGVARHLLISSSPEDVLRPQTTALTDIPLLASTDCPELKSNIFFILFVCTYVIHSRPEWGYFPTVAYILPIASEVTASIIRYTLVIRNLQNVQFSAQWTPLTNFKLEPFHLRQLQRFFTAILFLNVDDVKFRLRSIEVNFLSLSTCSA